MNSSFERLKILFIPVSCAIGSGEYVRSTILADNFKAAWPDADIRFILSKEAPYISKCKYQVLLTERSPTFHVKEVNKYINEFQPDVVLFDAAGRVSQIKHAKKSGAKVVYLAYYDKKIKRALQLRSLPYIDQIWITQPEFSVSKLSSWSKFKLRLLSKDEPVYLGSVYHDSSLENEIKILTQYGLKKGEYILINAGGGGHVTESGIMASELFYEAVERSESSSRFVQVWGENYPKDSLPVSTSEQCHLKSLANEDFIALMRNAKMLLISGGDTLLQALSMAKPLVCVPVAKDQNTRIKRVLQYEKAVLTSEPNLSSIVEQLNILNHWHVQAELSESAKKLSVGNGNLIALTALKRLLAF